MADKEADEILERIEDYLGSDAIAAAKTEDDVNELLAEWLGHVAPRKMEKSKRLRQTILDRAEVIREEEEEPIELPPEPPPRPPGPIEVAVRNFVQAVGKALSRLKFW